MKANNLTEYRILNIKKHNREYAKLQDDKIFYLTEAGGYSLGALACLGLSAFLVKLAFQEGAAMLLFELPTLLTALWGSHETICSIKDVKYINDEQKNLIFNELKVNNPNYESNDAIKLLKKGEK